MISILFILLIPLVSFGLTEKDIARSVLENYPLIQESNLKYESSKAELTAQRGAFDHKIKFKSRNRIEDRYDNSYIETTLERQTPHYGIGLFAGHRQGLGTFPAYDGKYETSSAGEIFAGITMPLFRNLQTDEARTNLALAKIQKALALAEIELKKNIYLHKALSVYYKWLVINQKIKIREEMLKFAEDRQTMLERKYKAGDIERLKLTDNQRSIDKRKDELAEAKIELRSIMNELSLYYRDEKGTPKFPEDNFYPSLTLRPIPDVTMMPHLPQVSLIDQEIELRKTERKLYQQSRRPLLNLDVLGAKELSANEPYDPDRLQIGVRFEYPFENRKAEGKTVATEYKFKALQKQKELVVQDLKGQLNFSIEALNLSKTRWELLNAQIDKTSKISKAERTRWNQGASDLYIVNLREQDLAEADIKRWTVWYDYHKYLLDAKLFSGSIISSYQ